MASILGRSWADPASFSGDWPRFVHVPSQCACRKIDADVNRLLVDGMGVIDTETRARIESLVAWWRDVGVDTAIDEEPHNWLAAVPVAVRSTQDDMPAASVIDTVTPAPARLPTMLPEFLIWWSNDTRVLEDFQKRRRLAPEGRAGTALMIVVDMPEKGDSETGRLLSGEGGALFDKMLTALKLTRADVYLATLAPSRTATAQIEDGLRDRLATVLNHHIALVGPPRLWLMGDAVTRAVLGIDVRQAMGRLHSVNRDGGKIDVIATVNLPMLLRQPERKSQAWRDMQKLFEGSRP